MYCDYRNANDNPPPLSADLSQLCRQLLLLPEQQLDLLRIMMGCGPLIAASVYRTFRTCSYPNCRCHKGHKHGPFPTISFTVDGKRRSRPIPRDNVALVEKKAAAYHLFQKTLTRRRALCRHSEAVLEKIRQLSLEQYP